MAGRRLRVPRELVAIGFLFAALGATAATIQTLQVSHDGGHYRITTAMTLPVAPSSAYRAASDFDRLAGLNPSIIDSHRLPGHRLSSTVRLCVLWFCKTMQQVMYYRLDPPCAIDMRVVPDAGDLHSGTMHWRFAPRGPGTTLTFSADIEPDFWVPPIIGPYLIAGELKRQARVTAASIERLAGAHAQSGNTR